ncbi:MAG: T9SS type A sorting domain-containing protein [Bacteroidia bacterium]|nr:T9SS type A sorting domain-containing protein [Bacteroidia bacterium]
MIKKLTIFIFSILMLSIIYNSFAYSGGNIPANSNAPSESNCTSCHSATLNAGSNLKNLIFQTNFAGGGYIPDSTYDMTVAFKEPSVSKFGFQITCLTETGNLKAGAFTTVDSRVQKTTATIGGNSREYLEHTSTGNVKTSTDSIYWKFKWKAPKNSGKIKFYIVINASNNNGSNSGDLIYSKSFSFGLSTLIPTADAFTNDSLSCAGYNVNFKGSGTQSPTSYLWSFPSATPSSSTLQNPTVTYANGGNKIAILTVKNVYGTSAPDTFNLIINPSPVLIFSNKSSYTICQGDSVKLSVSTSTPGTTFIWSPSGKTSASIFVKDSGIYYVTAKAPNSCIKTSTNVIVKLNLRPFVTLKIAPTKDTLCSGTAVRLTAFSKGADSFYFFNQSNLLFKSKDSFLNSSVLSNKNDFKIISKNNLGCFSSPTALNIIGIDQLSAPITFCVSNTTTSLTFGWSVVPNASGYQVSIDSGKTWITPSTGQSGTSHTVTGLSSDTKIRLRVRATSNTVCQFGAESILICQSKPCSNISYKISGDTLSCKGSIVKLNIRNLYDDQYSLRINGGAYSKDTIYTFNPLVTTTYKIEIKDSLSPGCPNISDELHVTVDTIPGKPNFTTSQNICKGDEAILSAFKGAKNYQFIYDGKIISNGVKDSVHFKPVVSSAVVIRYNYRICSDTVNSGNINVLNLTDAKYTATNNHYNYTFTANNNSAVSYRWNFTDTIQLTGNPLFRNMFKQKSNSFTLSLKVTDFNGCSNIYNDTFNVADYTGIDVVTLEKSITLFPNPASSIVNIATGNDNPYSIEIISIDGKTSKNYGNFKGAAAIDVSRLTAGSYFIRMNINGININKPLIIQ